MIEFPTSAWILLGPIALCLHVAFRIAQSVRCRHWHGFGYWVWRGLIGIGIVFMLLGFVVREASASIIFGLGMFAAWLIYLRLHRQCDRRLLLGIVGKTLGQDAQTSQLITIRSITRGWTRRRAKRILKQIARGRTFSLAAERILSRRLTDQLTIRAEGQAMTHEDRTAFVKLMHLRQKQVDELFAMFAVVFSLSAVGPIYALHAGMWSMFGGELLDDLGLKVTGFDLLIGTDPDWIVRRIAVTLVLFAPIVGLAIYYLFPVLLKIPPLSWLTKPYRRLLAIDCLACTSQSMPVADALQLSRQIAPQSERGALERLEQQVVKGIGFPNAIQNSRLIGAKVPVETPVATPANYLANVQRQYSNRIMFRYHWFVRIVVIAYVFIAICLVVTQITIVLQLLNKLIFSLS